MIRFVKACPNIPNLHPTVEMHALTMGLKPDHFWKTLFGEPPSNLEELRAHAVKYLNIEETT